MSAKQPNYSRLLIIKMIPGCAIYTPDCTGHEMHEKLVAIFNIRGKNIVVYYMSLVRIQPEEQKAMLQVFAFGKIKDMHIEVRRLLSYQGRTCGGHLAKQKKLF